MTPPRTLLLALAHPDDEAFSAGGVMARAAAEGHRVVMVCATRGEAGEISEGAEATPQTLGQVREAELRAAAAELGVRDVRFLGYRDSGMAGTAENQHAEAFGQASAAEVVGKLVGILRQARPDVVVTFEPGGLYGHPDHVAISRHATEAFDAAAEPGFRPELGAAHAAKRLYHIAIPKRLARAFVEEARRRGEELPWQMAEMGVEEDQIDARLDVRPWLERKLAALHAHATQRSDLDRMPPEMRQQFLSVEWFVLARGERGEELLAGL